ncbi:MAG TPA: DUF4129 domain-containing protein [Acidimicrobiales bacterium]|nr:DUF4129 domain-containing protein [Acidimicrobiales bacterium]
MALPDAGLVAALRAAELVGRWGGLGPFGGLPEPENDPGRVREMADDILSRPEYREPRKTIVERIQEAIGNFLEDILRNVGFGSSGAASGLAWVVMFVLGAVVAGLVFWLVRRIMDDGWGRGGRSGGEGDPVILAVDEHRTPGEWLAEAERHEAEGRWREGLLCRYRSLVTRLADLGIIPEAVGRTAGEYVGDVAERHPAGADGFRTATGLFETAWYGGVDRGSEGRDRFVDVAEAVLASAGNAGAGAGADSAEAGSRA